MRTSNTHTAQQLNALSIAGGANRNTHTLFTSETHTGFYCNSLSFMFRSSCSSLILNCSPLLHLSLITVLLCLFSPPVLLSVPHSSSIFIFCVLKLHIQVVLLIYCTSSSFFFHFLQLLLFPSFLPAPHSTTLSSAPPAFLAVFLLHHLTFSSDTILLCLHSSSTLFCS